MADGNATDNEGFDGFHPTGFDGARRLVEVYTQSPGTTRRCGWRVDLRRGDPSDPAVGRHRGLADSAELTARDSAALLVVSLAHETVAQPAACPEPPAGEYATFDYATMPVPCRGAHGRCCASLLSPKCTRLDSPSWLARALTSPIQPPPAGAAQRPSPAALGGRAASAARRRPPSTLPRPRRSTPWRSPTTRSPPEWAYRLVASELARLPTTTAAEQLAAFVDDILGSVDAHRPWPD
jgi:hypothetical protein